MLFAVLIIPAENSKNNMSPIDFFTDINFYDENRMEDFLIDELEVENEIYETYLDLKKNNTLSFKTIDPKLEPVTELNIYVYRVL